jgi:hypothetical protein
MSRKRAKHHGGVDWWEMDLRAQIDTSTARTLYLEKYMTDLPETYRQRLPRTTDQSELHLAERQIRAQYAADVARGKVPAQHYHANKKG